MAIVGSKTRAACLGMVALLALSSASLVAQEPAQDPPASKVSTRARRVPRYFGQVGLTPEQKENIYKIQATHLTKIEELERQIEDARAAMMAECEAVLTDAQRKLLEQRRGTARSRTRSQPAAEAAPKADDNAARTEDSEAKTDN